MLNRPLMMLALCWTAGSAAANMLNGSRLPAAWAGILFLLSLLAIWGRISWKYMLILWVSFTLAGMYWEWNDGRNYSSLPTALGLEAAQLEKIPVRAEGEIISVVQRDGDRVDFEVKLSDLELYLNRGSQARPNKQIPGEKIAVQVRLQAEAEIGQAAGWQRGDKAVLNGTLKIPSGARNFGGFDYRAYLRTREVHWLFKITGADSVQITPPSSWSASTALRWNDKARTRIAAEINQVFRGEHAGYMKGLLIGMQEDLDPETFMQFSRLGLTHILAISGMQVAVVSGFLLFLLTRVRLTRETALTITMFLIPVYVMLSGAGPSIVRAGIMGMIALYAARMGVLKDGLNILSAAALGMLVWNPYFLVSVSFQLSFPVTAGLIIYVPLTNRLLNFLPKWLRGPFSVTLVAQLVSFPLTIYYFNQFSFLSLAANFILVPFITFIILPLGAAAVLLHQIWAKAAFVPARALEWLNNAAFAVVDWMNGFHAGVTIWRSPSLLWICIYYLLLYAVLYFAGVRREMRAAPLLMEDETVPLEGSNGGPAVPSGGRGRTANGYAYPGRSPFRRYSSVAAAVLSLCFAYLLYYGYRPPPMRGAGHVAFLDVGQGDSILITAPGGANILIDGGGTLNFGQKEAWRIRRDPYEVGAKVLVPLLKKRGIHRLDAVILTHGDQDHAGGLQAVLEQIPVSSLLFNGTVADREEYLHLMKTAMENNVRLYAVQQGMAVEPDTGTRMTFLYPRMTVKEHGGLPVVDEQNTESVVFRLDISGASFIFTGDMEMEAETDILAWLKREAEAGGAAAGNPADFKSRADVLKVAHHGSKTSSSQPWLSYWKPKAAVIPVGANNVYGHPNDGVVSRISGVGSMLYRTDLNGEIQMKVHSGEIAVRYKIKEGE